MRYDIIIVTYYPLFFNNYDKYWNSFYSFRVIQYLNNILKQLLLLKDIEKLHIKYLTTLNLLVLKITINFSKIYTIFL